MQEGSDKRPRDSTRAVRSYVLRAGRITSGQQRALEALWPRFGVQSQAGRLDPQALFGRIAPLTLEIGFGNGENLAARAAEEPARDFLGIEVHRPGVGHLLLAAERLSLANLRVIAHDAVEVLEQRIADGSLDELQLLFPDPWPKKRHHKRRLVQPSFIALVASKLRVGGRWHIATDWEPYAEQMRADIAAEPRLAPVSAASGMAARASTRFQRRGERLGHRIQEFLYTRVGA